MAEREKGFNSGESGGTKIMHHSTSSVVSVVRVYKEEISQGIVELVTKEDWYDYAEIQDLFQALKQASKGNLKWLLKDQVNSPVVSNEEFEDSIKNIHKGISRKV